MLVLTLLSVLCTVAVVVISSRVAAGMACDMRGDVFGKVSSFSNAEFDRFSTASMITRSTNDITQVQLVAMMLIRFVFYALLMGIGGILRMLNKDVSMLWLIAGAVVFSIGFVIVVIFVATPRFRKKCAPYPVLGVRLAPLKLCGLLRLTCAPCSVFCILESLLFLSMTTIRNSPHRLIVCFHQKR
jgi:ABC-type multidrug transport system fused ATPase/permease subunit